MWPPEPWVKNSVQHSGSQGVPSGTVWRAMPKWGNSDIYRQMFASCPGAFKGRDAVIRLENVLWYVTIVCALTQTNSLQKHRRGMRWGGMCSESTMQLPPPHTHTPRGRVSLKLKKLGKQKERNRTIKDNPTENESMVEKVDKIWGAEIGVGWLIALLYKPKNMSSNPQHLCKRPGWVHTAVTPANSCGGRDRDTGAYWPLAQLQSKWEAVSKE